MFNICTSLGSFSLFSSLFQGTAPQPRTGGLLFPKIQPKQLKIWRCLLISTCAAFPWLLQHHEHNSSKFLSQPLAPNLTWPYPAVGWFGYSLPFIPLCLLPHLILPPWVWADFAWLMPQGCCFSCLHSMGFSNQMSNSTPLALCHILIMLPDLF